LFSSGVGVTFHNPLANKKQETIPEEIFQTLLNNKKTRIKREKYTFCAIKSFEQLKTSNPQFRAKTSHTFYQKPNLSRETIPVRSISRVSLFFSQKQVFAVVTQVAIAICR
jgi:hypothetical protein